jgi:hypothetical protein
MRLHHPEYAVHSRLQVTLLWFELEITGYFKARLLASFVPKPLCDLGLVTRFSRRIMAAVEASHVTLAVTITHPTVLHAVLCCS